MVVCILEDRYMVLRELKIMWTNLIKEGFPEDWGLKSKRWEGVNHVNAEDKN